MPFGLPITIKEATDRIHKKEYLLPAIQREFVWSSDQIEMLFDSLMRGYPISSFLFWKVERDNQKNYQFYEFIRDYHERDNKNNPVAAVNEQDAITAILDGQQRLTSLYIGLRGSYAYKLNKKRWDNPSAFPKRRLCLNLLTPSDSSDLEYDFQFKTDDEIRINQNDDLWFVVGDILSFRSLEDAMNYLIKNVVGKFPEHKMTFANSTLCKLYEVVHKTQSINYFLEEGETLDKVLNIFVRINSGGTQLSYSDLLLSIASAEWRERNAREEINSFIKEINSIGYGFNLNKDFVLKSCLVLIDKEMAFKVENFNKETMHTIEFMWPDIKKAIKSAVVLLSSFGYQRDTLTSSNAIIPIAYYLQKKGCPDNFDVSRSYDLDRRKIFKWLKIALLKRIFSGQPDNVLRPMREIIKENSIDFPIEKIISKFKGTTKSLSFDDDELEALISYEYGEAYTFSALAFLYSSLDFRNHFHLDHIYPKWMFTRKELLERGVSREDLPLYLDQYNQLANLQLLEGSINQEKSGKPVNEWISEMYPNEIEKEKYYQKNFIPQLELTINNFPKFIEMRKKLLISEFQLLLQ